MHIQTHLMSGWYVSNLFNLSKRERLMCMIAASVADLDGLSLIGGRNAYEEYHHKISHNLPVGLLACVVLWLLSGRRLKAFAIYIALFHLHLVMDFFGSGPFWPIYYLWPFSKWTTDSRQIGWEFYSWQNMTTAGVFLVWTIGIAVIYGRTPLEAIMPKLDEQLVVILRKWFGRRARRGPHESKGTES